MLNLFKKSKDHKLVLASQDYQAFIDALSEQLEFNMHKPAAMFKFALLFAEKTYEVNPQAFEALEKFKAGITKIQNENR